MHDRQTEILLKLERIEKLLVRLCSYASKGDAYYVGMTGRVLPTSSSTIDYQAVTGQKENPDLQGKNE